jgi:hypothetical protein
MPASGLIEQSAYRGAIASMVRANYFIGQHSIALAQHRIEVAGQRGPALVAEVVADWRV